MDHVSKYSRIRGIIHNIIYFLFVNKTYFSQDWHDSLWHLSISRNLRNFCPAVIELFHFLMSINFTGIIQLSQFIHSLVFIFMLIAKVPINLADSSHVTQNLDTTEAEYIFLLIVFASYQWMSNLTIFLRNSDRIVISSIVVDYGIFVIDVCEGF